MIRVGLIDNLQNIDSFRFDRFVDCSSDELMSATGGNTGNVAFVHATRKLIANPIVRIEWGSTPEFVKSNVDHVVVCCANQIGAHVDLGIWAEKLTAFNLPVTLVGLGAQSASFDHLPEIPEGTKSFLRTVSSLSRAKISNIASRGVFSSRVIDQVGIASSPIGCPSTLINADSNFLAKLKWKAIGDVRKVGVAAGNPWHEPSAWFERALIELVDKYRGEYVVQHPVSVLRFVLGDVTEFEGKHAEHFMKIYGFDNFQDLMSWFSKNASYFIDAPSWIHYSKRFDSFIGPRFHGVALAVQACVPGLVVAIDSRTRELCESSGIKWISLTNAREMKVPDLVQCARWEDSDLSRFSKQRMMCAQGYYGFLKDNGLNVSEHLRSILASKV